MSLGAGIFTFVVGAILAFAVNITVPWVDLRLVGYILMGAGVVIIVIGIALLARKRSSVTTTREGIDPVTGARVRQSERDDRI